MPQGELIDTIKGRFETAKAARVALVDEWRRTAEAYVGRRGSQPVLAYLAQEPIRAQAQRSLAYLNVVQRYVRTISAKILNQRPKPTVVPVTNSSEDREVARACEDWLQYLWRSKDMARKDQTAAFWQTMYGTVFWRVGWNPEGGEPIDIDPQIDPELAKLMPDKTGCLELDPINPHSVYLPPGAESIEQCRWVIISHTMHVDEVYERWGVVVVPGIDADSDRLERIDGGYAFLTDTDLSKENVTVLEYFERPSKAHKRGRYVITCRDEVLEEGKHYKTGEKGLPEEDIPLVSVIFNPLPESIWGRTPILDTLPLQSMINHGATKIAQTLQQSGHKWMIPTSSIKKPIGAGVGEHVEYDRNSSKPSLEQPTGVNAQQFTWLDKLAEFNQFITGAGDVTLGQAPGSDPSGRAIRFQAEQENIAFGLPTLAYRTGLSDLARWSLTLTKRHAFRPVLYSVVGTSGLVEMRQLEAEDIRFRDVEYQVESQDAYTKQAMRDTFMQLVQLGLVQDQKMILDFLELPSRDTMYAQDIDQREVAKTENLDHEAGEPLGDPKDWENHNEHAACHERYMRGPRFYRLDQQAQMLMVRHNLVHHAFMGHNPFPIGFTPMMQQMLPPPPAPEGPPAEAPPADGGGGQGAPPSPPPPPSPESEVDERQVTGMLPPAEASAVASQPQMEHNPEEEAEAINDIRGIEV